LQSSLRHPGLAQASDIPSLKLGWITRCRRLELGDREPGLHLKHLADRRAGFFDPIEMGARDRLEARRARVTGLLAMTDPAKASSRDEIV
jgi:hypothetical protein